MANTVATFAIKLGLDPSSIPAQLRGVTVNLTSEQRRLAAEMKSTAQTGVLSFRMLSESMDVGLSRPLTRFLTQTFPALSSALASVVGFAAFGAGAYYALMAYEHLSKKIEEAVKKEQEYAEAVQKTKMVIAEADAASEIRLERAKAKLAGEEGDRAGAARYKGFAEEAEATQRAAAMVDKLTEAELKEARANMARSAFWSSVGKVTHELFTSDTQLRAEKIVGQMASLQTEFSLRSAEDEVKHTATAMQLLAEESTKAHAALVGLQAAQAHQQSTGFAFDVPGQPRANKGQKIGKEEVEAAQAYADQIDRIVTALQRMTAATAAEHAADILGQSGNVTRRELEAIDHLVSSLKDKAAAENQAAVATQRGSAASIAAAAAAAAGKDISDLLASAQEKLKSGDIGAAQFRQIKAALEGATAAIREYSLEYEQARALGEYNRGLAEFNLRTRESIQALDEQAAGLGKVAKEQARAGQGLVGQQEKYEGLYGKTVPAPAPAVGPPSLQQQAYGELQGAKADVGIEQAKIQTTWYVNELAKVKAAAIEASDPTPWNRTESKLAELKIQGSATAEQMTELSAAMHFADAAGALEKLLSKVNELQAVHAALVAGSPYPELEAEAVKLAADQHLTVEQVRAQLTTTQQLANANRAMAAVRALQPGGGGSRIDELEREAAAVREMGAENQKNENVQLAVRLRLEEINKEMDDIVLKTGSAGAGFAAWLDSLKMVESEGQFVFNELTQAAKGFESNAADSLIKILESHHEQHAKLIHELRQMWESYFAGLTKMALEHGMQKLLQPVGDVLSKMFGGGKTDLQKQFAAGPGKMFSDLAKGGGKDAALASNTASLNTLTVTMQQVVAAMQAGGAGGIGGGGGGGFSGLLSSLFGGGAGAGDAAAAGGGASGYRRSGIHGRRRRRLARRFFHFRRTWHGARRPGTRRRPRYPLGRQYGIRRSA